MQQRHVNPEFVMFELTAFFAWCGRSVRLTHKFTVLKKKNQCNISLVCFPTENVCNMRQLLLPSNRQLLLMWCCWNEPSNILKSIYDWAHVQTHTWHCSALAVIRQHWNSLPLLFEWRWWLKQEWPQFELNMRDFTLCVVNKLNVHSDSNSWLLNWFTISSLCWADGGDHRVIPCHKEKSVLIQNGRSKHVEKTLKKPQNSKMFVSVILTKRDMSLIPFRVFTVLTRLHAFSQHGHWTNATKPVGGQKHVHKQNVLKTLFVLKKLECLVTHTI